LVELLDGDDNVLKELTGDDADDWGATSAEHIAPNPIGSNVVGQAYPSVADRIDAITSSVSGQKRKYSLPALKRKQSKTLFDHMMTQIELPLYRRPRRPLNLVPLNYFWASFWSLWHASQAAGAGTSAGGVA
jgi:hypothetical protein